MHCCLYRGACHSCADMSYTQRVVWNLQEMCFVVLPASAVYRSSRPLIAVPISIAAYVCLCSQHSSLTNHCDATVGTATRHQACHSCADVSYIQRVVRKCVLYAATEFEFVILVSNKRASSMQGAAGIVMIDPAFQQALARHCQQSDMRVILNGSVIKNLETSMLGLSRLRAAWQWLTQHFSKPLPATAHRTRFQSSQTQLSATASYAKYSYHVKALTG